ncbi:iron-sulfur cluster assembly scaffold protein [Legionella worsleiensis]|uniref:NifU family transporter iron binding protein n=1 Tax=Legionella worsleiensis TaxID=45076 RepID=A0A0W1A472_9GAMM|nr:iron-sulfur cluster assembly scaffold protein [Legionella worsleiensis]KTD76143.1 NifU family transporter iron binding protein [Legionella worsleiensis]STY33281.1 NifU family iron binding protein [Fe-S] cluster formation/repair protein IscU, HesB [Legionella worsleiensis]
MMYNEVVEHCFFHPQHVGVLDLDDPLVVRYTVEQQKPKVIIELYIQCQVSGFISRICFKASGSPFVIAALEWLCRNTEGTHLMQQKTIDYQTLINVLEIPLSQYPVALLVEDVYQESLKLMQQKLERYES